MRLRCIALLFVLVTFGSCTTKKKLLFTSPKIHKEGIQYLFDKILYRSLEDTVYIYPKLKIWSENDFPFNIKIDDDILRGFIDEKRYSSKQKKCSIPIEYKMFYEKGASLEKKIIQEDKRYYCISPIFRKKNSNNYVVQVIYFFPDKEEKKGVMQGYYELSFDENRKKFVTHNEYELLMQFLK